MHWLIQRLYLVYKMTLQNRKYKIGSKFTYCLHFKLAGKTILYISSLITSTASFLRLLNFFVCVFCLKLMLCKPLYFSFSDLSILTSSSFLPCISLPWRKSFTYQQNVAKLNSLLLQTVKRNSEPWLCLWRVFYIYPSISLTEVNASVLGLIW